MTQSLDFRLKYCSALDTFNTENCVVIDSPRRQWHRIWWNNLGFQASEFLTGGLSF
jgi:hypothetical protein